MQSNPNQIAIKIFCGIELTSEINMHLNESILWKNAEVEKKEDGIIRVRFDDKDYIGMYLSHRTSPLPLIRQLESKVKEKLNTFCPKVKIDKKPLVIFPQTFIS
jgi:hypothetical protein